MRTSSRSFYLFLYCIIYYLFVYLFFYLIIYLVCLCSCVLALSRIYIYIPRTRVEVRVPPPLSTTWVPGFQLRCSDVVAVVSTCEPSCSYPTPIFLNDRFWLWSLYGLIFEITLRPLEQAGVLGSRVADDGQVTGLELPSSGKWQGILITARCLSSPQRLFTRICKMANTCRQTYFSC